MVRQPVPRNNVAASFASVPSMRKNEPLANQGREPIWALYGVFERLRDPRWTNIPIGVFQFFVLNGGMKAMRFAARALVAGFLLVCCRGAVATETGSGWWPFGHHADAATSQPQTASQTQLPSATTTLPQTTMPPAGPVAYEAQMPASAEANSDSHWMLSTPKKKVSWPTLHMPELPKSLSSKSASAAAPEATKNRWVEKEPVTPKTSPMQSVKNGAHSVAAGTKSAWHKTVAAVTPDTKTKKPETTIPPHVARRDVSPPFWKKMLGAKEPQMQQPQTVPQWMAQRRVDP
jgi:hypothetical protein